MASGDLSNKVAIITGSNSGFGQATAILFAKKGASVVLCGRDQERLDAAVALCIEASGGQADRFIGVNGDINDANVRRSIMDKAIQTFGKLDILVGNAGISLPGGDIDKCTEEIFDEIFNTNVKSNFFLTQTALPHLERSKGNVVFVSSVSSTVAIGKVVVYPMSKATVDHMTRCLSLDLAPKGIRVNAVNPAYVPTNLQRVFISKGVPSSAIGDLERPRHPLHGDLVTVEDVANNIAFLASDAAKSVTGQCVILDNGRRFMGPL